jgi:hypothetical protein
MLDKKFYEFDPDWLLAVINSSITNDPYLSNHPEIVRLLNTELPKCKLLFRKLNPSYDRSVNYYFVDPVNPNKAGSDWQFKTNIKINGNDADLIFNILSGDRLGSVEVWYPPR